MIPQSADASQEGRALNRRLEGVSRNPCILGGNIAGLRQFSASEKVFFHFFAEEFSRFGFGEGQPIFIDQARLMLEPALPGFLRDIFKDSFAEIAGIGRSLEAFGFFAELDALDGSGHVDLPVLRFDGVAA